MIRTVEQKVIKFINANDLIKIDDKILVALSGGPDSVFLFEFLIKFKRRFRIEIGVFHLNHKLRGKDANDDEFFCKNLAKTHKIEFYGKTKNVKLFAKRNALSLETAGRELRYKELFSTARKLGFTKIATAHNSDDNAETILLNMFRGAGLKGLTGIPVKRDNIIRPLLSIKKFEILNYLEKKKISYRIDETNQQSDYQRNFLRNKIIPLISEKFNPDFQSALFRNSAIIKNILEYVDGLVNEKTEKVIYADHGKVEIDLAGLNKIDNLLQDYFFKNVLEKHFNIEVSNQSVLDIKKLTGKQVGKEINLPQKVIAVRERNKIVLYKKPAKSSIKFNISLKTGEIKKVGGKSISIKLLKNNKKLIGNNLGKEYVSADKLSDRFQLRNWKSGDRFYPLGMKGSKKISDFLTEQKIDSTKRKHQLVLINNNKIVWVVNLRIDERFKVTKKTKRVCELCLI